MKIAFLILSIFAASPAYCLGPLINGNQINSATSITVSSVTSTGAISGTSITASSGTVSGNFSVGTSTFVANAGNIAIGGINTSYAKMSLFGTGVTPADVINYSPSSQQRSQTALVEGSGSAYYLAQDNTNSAAVAFGIFLNHNAGLTTTSNTALEFRVNKVRGALLDTSGNFNVDYGVIASTVSTTSTATLASVSVTGAAAFTSATSTVTFAGGINVATMTITGYMHGRLGGYTVITAGDTTPSVAGTHFLVYSTAADITITNFDDGVDGQVITVLCASGSNTLTITRDNAYLPGGAIAVLNASDTITLIKYGATWKCIAGPNSNS